MPSVSSLDGFPVPSDPMAVARMHLEQHPRCHEPCSQDNQKACLVPNRTPFRDPFERFRKWRVSLPGCRERPGTACSGARLGNVSTCLHAFTEPPPSRSGSQIAFSSTLLKIGGFFEQF